MASIVVEPVDKFAAHKQSLGEKGRKLNVA